jgi:Outer membrane protein beta-barrel domain
MKSFFTVEMQKVKAVVLVSGLVIGLNAFAETSTYSGSASQYRIAPTLGYTYFNIQGDTVDYSFKSGNSIGVVGQMTLDQDSEIETGLEYMETGAKIAMDIGWFSLDVAELHINQLAIPFRYKYFLNAATENNFRYFFKGGLLATYVVKASLEATEEKQDVKSEINAFGGLANLGFGVDKNFMGGKATLDLSYNYGVSKLMKNSNGRSVGYVLQASYAIAI